MNIKQLLMLSAALCAYRLSAAPMTYIVGNLNDSGAGSFRQAILDSNANQGTWSNTITFTTSGTITPATDLDTITQTVLIDGYTAPGSSVNTHPSNMPNNAVVMVELQGPGAGLNLPTLNGLTVTFTSSDGSVIRGLCINNFAAVNIINDELVPGAGIELDSDNNTIEGCFIGTAPDGATPFINAQGVLVYGNNTTVGGTTNDARNLLVGAIGQFGQTGVISVNSSGQTTITGNTIGLTSTGDIAPNTGTQVGIFGGGGALTITNNVVSGHAAGNVVIVMNGYGFGAQTITNNFIGTDITGQLAIPENGVGIAIISLATPSMPGIYIIDGNTISGNTNAIVVGQSYYVSVTGAQITNNFIGTDPTGTTAIPNTQDAIYLNRSVNTFIGSNIISSNGGSGIVTGKAKNTTIKSNMIGTDITGTVAMGNALNGIQLGTVVAVGVPSFGDIVGGALFGEGNLIANNGGYGIQVVSYTQQETIQGNTITSNALDGIRMGPKSSNNWVGGFRNAGNNLLTGELQSQEYVNLGPLGTSNVITGNGGYGISAFSSNGNAIQTNIIMDNGSDGITLVDSSYSLVGGKDALAKPAVEIPPVMGNVITNNGGFGVSVVQNTGKAIDNSILSNQIFGNASDGIELVTQ